MILRTWRADDAGALYKYASDGRVSELALWPRHDSIGMSRKVIEEIFIPCPHTFAIVLKAVDELVGCIGLVPQGEEHYVHEDKEREVGYWIGYPYWGQGLVSEALEAIIEYCRNTMRLKSLLIANDKRNVASQRVAEKCGFKFIEEYEYDGVCSKAYRLVL